MCNANWKTNAEKKFGNVLHVETSALIEDGASSGVRGRTTQYGERIADCTRSKLRDRGETVGESVIGKRGRPKKAIHHNQHHAGKVDVLVLNLQLPGMCSELHLHRPHGKESVLSSWVVRPQAHK